MATAHASTPCSICRACTCSMSPGLSAGVELPAGLRLIGGDGRDRGRLPGVRGDRRSSRSAARRLHDIPAFGAPVELSWRQRRYRCGARLPGRGFSEDHALAPSRAKLTVRAAWWAISCIQRDNASVAAVARRLGVDWHTVWDAIAPLLAELADDPDRLRRGRHTRGGRAHLAPSAASRARAEGDDRDHGSDQAERPTQTRLLDLIRAGPGKVYADWLATRGERFIG